MYLRRWIVLLSPLIVGISTEQCIGWKMQISVDISTCNKPTRHPAAGTRNRWNLAHSTRSAIKLLSSQQKTKREQNELTRHPNGSCEWLCRIYPPPPASRATEPRLVVWGGDISYLAFMWPGWRRNCWLVDWLIDWLVHLLDDSGLANVRFTLDSLRPTVPMSGWCRFDIRKLIDWTKFVVPFSAISELYVDILASALPVVHGVA